MIHNVSKYYTLTVSNYLVNFHETKAFKHHELLLLSVTNANFDILHSHFSQLSFTISLLFILNLLPHCSFFKTLHVNWAKMCFLFLTDSVHLFQWLKYFFVVARGALVLFLPVSSVQMKQ